MKPSTDVRDSPDATAGRWRRIGTATAGRMRTASRNFVYRMAAGLLAVVVVLVVGVLWAYWSSLYKDAQTRAGTLAFLLAEQTTRTFQAVDLTLAGLEPVFEAAPLPDHAPAFEKLLQQRVAELDFIHALYVIDPDGRVTETSGDLRDTVSSTAAKHYFDAFAREPGLKFLIGQPLFVQPRQLGRPGDRSGVASLPAESGSLREETPVSVGTLSAIPVMRRLAAPSGAFRGMMVASLDPRYFSDFYRNLDLGRRGSIDLYQDNGSILLASTSEDQPAAAVPALSSAPTFDLASTLGNFRSPGAEADQRLVAFHRAGAYPLVVAVGIDLADLRLRWWRVAAPTLTALLAILVMGASLAVMVARRLEERRRARNRAMTMQKLEALGQMTASVSHDFRNLLTVMTSTLRLVRKRGPDETVLKAAEEAVERGARLITQLLAFSKRDEMQIEALSINALLDGVAEVLRHAAGPGVTLAFDKAEGLPACKADQTQFDAALMNLVVNARQAMPEGGRVTITTSLAGGGVALLVADTGSGIAPADIRRVFEPFFTTKADVGTGLGLAQVYGFMRRIGGDVTVASQPGRGTTFTLLFPRADPRPGRDETRPTA